MNQKIKQAMREEDSNVGLLGQKLNTTRTELLKELKTSMNDYISEDLLTRLTKQEIVDEDHKNAQKELEKVVSQLFELKLSHT